MLPQDAALRSLRNTQLHYDMLDRAVTPGRAQKFPPGSLHQDQLLKRQVRDALAKPLVSFSGSFDRLT